MGRFNMDQCPRLAGAQSRDSMEIGVPVCVCGHAADVEARFLFELLAEDVCACRPLRTLQFSVGCVGAIFELSVCVVE